MSSIVTPIFHLALEMYHVHAKSAISNMYQLY